MKWERDSANIGEKLQKRDFKQTLILKGGMLTWVEEVFAVGQKLIKRNKHPLLNIQFFIS